MQWLIHHLDGRYQTLLLDWAAAHRDRVDLPEPRGGVTAVPRLNGIDDTTAFCHELEARDGVLVVPGGCFQHPDRIRAGFGGTAD
ncbi:MULTISPECIES: hypothetical protein [Streptomyces]